jgi:cytochrome b subunit of formate dehydrogenase
MDATEVKTFSKKKFVSISLFITAIVLFVTGLVIQIFEGLNNEFFSSLFTAIHVLIGITFTVLFIHHIKINWLFIKSYIKNKDSLTVSKETIYAVLLTILPILIGIIFVFFDED